jgi:hypothetical protein
VGADLDTVAGREAAWLAAMNVIAIARKHLGSLDRIKLIVRLGVSVMTEGNVASEETHKRHGCEKPSNHRVTNSESASARQT